MSKRDYLLDDHFPVGPIALIQMSVCAQYGLTMAELCGAQRARRISGPRQEAMYRAKKETLASLPEIGRAFGGRDHTTVLHAVRVVEKRISQVTGG